MKTVVQEALGYAGVSAGALITDITALYILVHYLSWWYVAAATTSSLIGLLVVYALMHSLIAKRGAAGCTFVWNFAAHRQFLFVRRRAA
jgi:putative flippase GtrA